MSYDFSDSTIKANMALDELRIQSNKVWAERQYTKSIIAIVDIMGIKEWFCGEPDFVTQMKIFKTWDFIIQSAQLSEVKRDLAEKYGDFPLKYSILSDSIVMSISVNVPSAFSKLMMYLRLIINSTFVEIDPPFMTRGAVVIGELFQEGNIVFGPGLLKAHLMEKNNAVNFRHIIDKQDYEFLNKNKDEATQNILIGWFNKDNDGYYYYDYLKSYLGYVDNRINSFPDENAGQSGVLVLNKINKKINDEIKSNANKDVVKKYKWLRTYFNKTMKRAIYKTDNDEHIWLKNSYKKTKN